MKSRSDTCCTLTSGTCSSTLSWMNYQTKVRALSLVSGDLYNISTQTDEQITLAQATAAHQHLNSILRQQILATRIGEPWGAQHWIPNVASTTSPSSIETSTACRSTQTTEQCKKNTTLTTDHMPHSCACGFMS